MLGQLARRRKFFLAGSVLRSSTFGTFGTFGRIRAFTLRGRTRCIRVICGNASSTFFAMRKRSWRNSGLRSVRKHAITARATYRRTAFASR